MVKLHIGFDDTDSPNGGCTTYIAALLVEKLDNMGFSFFDYPNLVRLNPNVPWKTRGNGALCLRINCPENKIKRVKEIIIETVESNSELDYDGTDPGIAFLVDEVPKEVINFAAKAKQSMLKIEEALKLAKEVNAEVLGFKRERGIIGSLAAIGEDLSRDHTFEIISYRTVKNRNKPRRIQISSVKKMDKNSPLTFNNVDPETGRILITPRGPDPILCGIRGETPEAVKHAFEMIVIDEPIERWMIFRTNQGTDAHLQKISAIADIKAYNPVIVQGVVSKEPKIIKGGHVIFSIMDKTGEVDCAAYEPTVTLNKMARRLMKGDILKVFGGVRPPFGENQLTVNLEKIRVIELASSVFFKNPNCPKCGKRMKSMGKNQGLRCDKCSYRASQPNKIQVIEERGIEKRLYITSPRSQRHLTKPYCRYGKEKIGFPKILINNWHFP